MCDSIYLINDVPAVESAEYPVCRLSLVCSNPQAVQEGHRCFTGIQDVCKQNLLSEYADKFGIALLEDFRL